jgi:predicted MFS family arabinose efflux permease
MTMGLSNAAQNLGPIAGPTLGGLAFDLNIEYPNYLGAVVMAIGFLASLPLLKRHAPKKEHPMDIRELPC